ncbi:nitroreductase [Paenibacillus doosanensis]|uniref:Putative NAD(P)H nitroreductase n=1 Tax=Paenibacillus konkukensis TaxID=2020716 RepID=A0ABY4RQB6_9BACL|nr:MULTISPECIES: nitroreductase [Paenibacillus]MCS7459634.1 nitroreductase [Paenibacillus doosanensis]UQZ84706.1 Putative NAD(P)H nitroreductase YdjA [Paenibacillus konkukensis]
MELARLIKERRSVHQFEDRPVAIELIKELLDTAVWVPNHKMTQPWRFVIVQGEGRRRLADVARAGAEKREKDPAKSRELGQKFHDRFMSVPLFVAAIMTENTHPVVREEDYASMSCIIHNFSLLAWERELGLVWETYPLLHVPEFREALGVRPGEKIIGSLHVGYPSKVPPAQPRIPAEQLITVIDEA